MNHRVSFILVLFGCCCLWQSAAGAGEPVSANQLLEPIRARGDLPGLAAAVVRNGRIVAWGLVGVRKTGSGERVTLQDKWHIGSCTKSMTAAVVGMMIEQEGWRWDMTVAEMLPGLAGEIHPGWRKATLAQFVSHFSGAGDNEGSNPGLLARADLAPLEQRKQFIREFLVEHGPANPPGTTWFYDNANFIVVGHAIELKLKQPWETILRERLFKPLGMGSAGFGPPASGAAVDQPWGHVPVNGKFVPVPPDAQGDMGIWMPELGVKVSADNPAALTPAGMVHCTIADLAKYAAWQLRGARGGATLLKASTFNKLHTPYNKKMKNYACGWEVDYQDWAGGEAIHHGGSNGTFMTAMWLAPEKDFAVVVCANAGGSAAQSVVNEAVDAMIEEYLLEE